MGYWDVNCLVGRWPSAALAYHDLPGLLARMDQLGIARALVAHTHSLTFDPSAGNATRIWRVRQKIPRMGRDAAFRFGVVSPLCYLC